MNSRNEISSSRVLNAPVEAVYEAFANPGHLQNWWGPEGFTNTIHEFNLQEGGKWLLTMHGPEIGNYENASVFKTVRPNELVAWTRLTQPYFDMEIIFDRLDKEKSRITFKMIFTSPEMCEKMRVHVVPKNEENFDRLERELPHVKGF